MQNCRTQPTAKLRLEKVRKLTIGSAAVKTRQKKAIAEIDADPGADRNGRVLHPLMLRTFLQHVFQRAEEAGHEEQAPPVEAVEQLEMRLVEIDQRQHAQGDADAGHDVDEEQPVPRHQIGDVAADRRADRGSQGRNKPDDGTDDVEFGAREYGIGRGEHGRDHAGAQKALKGTPEDHLLDRGGEAAEQARGVKPAAEIANSSRVPKARDKKPDSGIAITSAIR